MQYYACIFKSYFHWWLVESHHIGCFCLFAPIFWEDGRDLWMILSHSVNASWVVGTLRCGGDSQTLWAVIDLFELFVLRDGGDTKTLLSCFCTLMLFHFHFHAQKWWINYSYIKALGRAGIFPVYLNSWLWYSQIFQQEVSFNPMHCWKSLNITSIPK